MRLKIFTTLSNRLPKGGSSMQFKKIAITDCDHKNVNQEIQVLKEAGMEFSLFQCKSEADVIEKCKDYEAFINQYAPITRKVFESLPHLRIVVRYGVGVDNIDIEAAQEYGVQICNVPDYGMHEVADQACALTLALVRKLVFSNQVVHQNQWDYTKAIPIYRLQGKTVGIIGLGRIGCEYAKRMHAFGVKVIAVERVGFINPIDFVEIVSMETLLKTADIISIHCPLNGNENLLAMKEINMMKENVILINVSRGGILHEDSVIQGIEKGIIGAIGLDVVSKEPFLVEDSKLASFENVLITPHMAWYSEESAIELKRKVALEVVRFLNGEEVWYPINKPN